MEDRNNGLNLDKQTIDTLRKYGVNLPERIEQGRKLGFKKNNIVINNNNNNITNNNISGPVQGRDLAILREQEEKKKKKLSFKNWIDKVFSAHEDEVKVRNKVFEKQESSLLRTSERLINGVSKFGKKLVSAFNAKELVSYINGDSKKLFILWGVHLISTNWQKLLKFVSGIERRLTSFSDYLYGGTTNKDGKSVGGKVSGLVSDFRSLITGKSDTNKPFSTKDTIFLTLASFLGIAKQEAGNVAKSGKSLSESMVEFTRKWFEERGRCLKLMPGLDLTGKENTVERLLKIGKWLGDFIGVFFGGSKSLVKAFDNRINTKGLKESISSDSEKKLDWLTSDEDAINGIFDSKSSDGGATMRVQDFDSEGNLNGSISASLNQSSTLERMLTSDFDISRSAVGNGRDVNIKMAGIVSGFSRLEKAASKKDNTGQDGVVVSPKLLNVISKTLGINLKGIPVKQEEWKMIKSPLTKKEINDNLSRSNNVANSIADDVAYDMANKLSGGATKWVSPGKATSDLVFGTVGTISGFDAIGGMIGIPELKKLVRYSSNAFDAYADTNVIRHLVELKGGKLLRLVPASYKLQPGEEPAEMEINGKKQKTIKLTRLDTSSINFLKKKIAEKAKVDNINFNMADYSKLEKIILPGIKSQYEQRIRNNGGDPGKLNLNFKDGSFSEQDKAELDKIIEEYKNNTWEDVISPNLQKFGDTLSKSGSRVISSIPISASTMTRVKYLVGQLMSKLGLTKEQALGLTGHLVYESGGELKPDRHTGGRSGPITYSDIGGTAYGIGQWRGDRIKFLIDRYGTTPTFEEEVDYVIWEFQNIPAYKMGLKKIKSATTVESAAAMAFGYYGFSAGVEKGIKALGGNGRKMFNEHIKRALLIADKYNKSISTAGENAVNKIQDKITNSDASTAAAKTKAGLDRASKATLAKKEADKKKADKLKSLNRQTKALSKITQKAAEVTGQMAEESKNRKSVVKTTSTTKSRQESVGSNK